MAGSKRFTGVHGALLIIDVQTKLMKRIHGREEMLRNVMTTIKAAQLLEILTLATEQFPTGLGPSVPDVAQMIEHRTAKTTFHCCASTEIVDQLRAKNITQVTLVGIEAHVCVAQTALELLLGGFEVQVLADAVSSRHVYDREIALRRLEHAGVVISTTEAALFEWTETALHPKFKAISALVKEADTARSTPHD